MREDDTISLHHYENGITVYFVPKEDGTFVFEYCIHPPDIWRSTEFDTLEEARLAADQHMAMLDDEDPFEVEDEWEEEEEDGPLQTL